MWKMLTDVKGEGAPLVLVGGGLTGYLSWIPIQEKLSPQRQVVRVQPLAVQLGLEDKLLPPDYSVDLESEGLGAALDDLGLRGPVDLAAWSYGAAITLDYALDHPERVLTLTLIEPPAFWTLEATGMLDERSQKESDDLHALYRGMKAKGSVSEEDLDSFMQQAGFGVPGTSLKSVPQWPSWVKHRRSLLTGDAAWNHRDSEQRLRAFDRPVLLVKGTGSSYFLHRIIDALGTRSCAGGRRTRRSSGTRC
jgi:pimeloyl-ACP methyl ester carboxylesterase